MNNAELLYKIYLALGGTELEEPTKFSSSDVLSAIADIVEQGGGGGGGNAPLVIPFRVYEAHSYNAGNDTIENTDYTFKQIYDMLYDGKVIYGHYKTEFSEEYGCEVTNFGQFAYAKLDDSNQYTIGVAFSEDTSGLGPPMSAGYNLEFTGSANDPLSYYWGQ